MSKNTWEKNYKMNRFNKYPFSEIITYTMRLFPSKNSRKKIKVLDLGCGGGTHTNFFVDEGFDYYAIDSSKTSIRLTKSRLRKKNLKKKIINSRFENLPFKNNYFDFIIDRHSLTHNSISNIQLITEEIRRVLKKRGIFLSMIFGDKHSEKRLGKKFYDETRKKTEFFFDFKKGDFKKNNKVNFFNKKIIHQIFRKFKILSLTEKSYETSINYKRINLPKKYNGWSLLMSKKLK